MRRILAGLLAALLIITLAACGRDRAAPETGKLQVVATIFPPYDFVRAIAGDRVELTMLLPPGAESHSYEPSPQDMVTIQNSGLFICVGGKSEAWVEEVLKAVGRDDLVVLRLMDMVDVVEEEHVEGMEAAEEEHGEEAEYDEHVWTSPKNAIRIVEKIAQTLCDLDEENAPAYRQAAEVYIGKLEELDETFEEIVSGAVRKTIVFGDRFPFRYFADAYGLDYYAAFPGCAEQSEPSARTVAFLIDKVQAEGIPVVFCVEMSSGKIADAICEATGARKRLLHSCHVVSRDDFLAGKTYLELMEENAVALKEALWE